MALMEEKWIRDTGLIFALAALFLAYKGILLGIPIAALLVLAVLFVPKILWPLAWLWHTLAHGLGFVMQRVFFGLVFFIVITPVAVIRKIFVYDALSFFNGASTKTAFVARKKRAVERKDLNKPY
jgi:hypothetical protein